MAQVCIDSKVFTDMRFKALARELVIHPYEAIGRCLCVWHCCMQMQKSELPETMVNDSAERAGFAMAMVNAGLARVVDEQKRLIYIAGTKGNLEKKSELPKPTGLNKVAEKKVVHPPIGVNEVIALYHDEFLKLYKIKWKPDGKSLGIAKSLVKDFGLDSAKCLVTAYFQIKRQDFTRKHHDWGTFKLNLNVVQVQSGIGRVVGTEESKKIERTDQNISAAQRYLQRVEQEGHNDETS